MLVVRQPDFISHVIAADSLFVCLSIALDLHRPSKPSNFLRTRNWQPNGHCFILVCMYNKYTMTFSFSREHTG